MTTPINQNPDDFLVYFSDVEVNGTQDLSLVENETKLVFDGEFSAIGDKKVISYDVTNASKNYDAEVTISCTESTTYLTITNVFDTSSNLSARSTKTGTLTVELSTAVSEETLEEVTCTLSASAVERTSHGSGEVSAPLEKPIAIGDEISIGDEKFNVISTTDDTVTMLAQYNITDVSPYTQTTTQTSVTFSNTYGWEHTPGPKEIDVQTWGGDVKTILNGYVDYLNSEYDVNVTGDLITLAELGQLGCTIPSDYASGSLGWNCNNSKYNDWLVNGQNWWTHSADSEYSSFIWTLSTGGNPVSYDPLYAQGVRPVITISKSEL